MLRILVGQVAHLELVEQLAHLLLFHQQGRHHHQGGERLRHALGEVELGQRIRLEDRGDGVIYQVDRALGGGEQ